MPSRLPQIPRSALSLIGALAIAAVAIIVFAGNEARLERGQRVAAAERQFDSLTMIIGAQLERDVRSVKLVMSSAQTLAADLDLAQPGLDSHIHPALHHLAMGLPSIANLLLVDQQGDIVASSTTARRPDVNLQDRVYFRFHASAPSQELRFGENMLSRTMGFRVVQFSQRISGEGGKFCGIVVAGLRHDYFAALFRSFAPGDDVIVRLLRQDGQLLAQYPVPDDDAFAHNQVGDPVFARLTKSPSGTFETPTVADARLHAYRQLTDLPWVIEVSQGKGVALAAWRSVMWRQIGITLLALVSMFGLGAVILAQILRQERQTRALRESEERFRTLFDSAADCIFLVRGDGTIVSANTQTSITLDQPASSIVGQALSRFLVEPEETVLLHALSMLGSVPSEGMEGTLRGSNDVLLPVELRFSRVQWESVNLYLGLARDISERKSHQAQLERLASFDELTHVPKRNLFLDRLEQSIALARRNGRKVGVLFVDLDRFKTINDTLGHACGDRVLQQSAQRMLACLRHVDTVGRYGGDEFVVLLPEITNVADIETVAQKICGEFRQPFDLQGQTASIGASVGIAVFPQDGDSAESLVRHADEAMYAAKLAGRDQVQHFAGH